MRRGTGKAKGADFERQIAKELSLWWTNNEHDDVFWRTAGSGARATVRAQAQKESVSGHGDLMAYHSIGEPFTDLFCVEIKRGYYFNLFDIYTRKHGGDITDFWKQACKSAEDAGGKYPLLIWKPDRVPCFAVFQHKFALAISPYSPLNLRDCITFYIDDHKVHLALFSSFLEKCTPEALRKLHENDYII